MNTRQMERLLYEYSDIYEHRKELQLKINEVLFLKQSNEDNLRSLAPSGFPKSTELQDAVFECVRRIIDEYQVHLDYYHGELEELNMQEKHILEAFKYLDPIERDVITLRYFKGHSWNVIPFKVHCSERECYRIKLEALYKLIENYKNGQ